jgi:aldehyde dehydrogenase (NAD+)
MTLLNSPWTFWMRPANGQRYAVRPSSGIATTSLKYAAHFKRNAGAGMVMVNPPTAGVDFHAPFGLREQGKYAAEFFTTVKTA